MQRYLTIGLIFIAIGLIAGAYYKGQQAGVDAERAEWQARDLARQAEIIKLQQERDEARAQAEKVKIKREVVYRDRIRTVEKIVDACLDQRMPDCLLYQLQEAGIYTGPRLEAAVCEADHGRSDIPWAGEDHAGDAASP